MGNGEWGMGNPNPAAIPAQHHFSGAAAFHQVEAFLELVNGQLMRKHLAQRKAVQHQLRHLVPGLVHLAPVDAVQREAFENDLVPVHAGALGQQSQQCDLAAVIHAIEHVAERARVAAHFQAHVEPFHVQVGHDVLERGVGHVHHARGAHVRGQFQAEVVDVGDHHVARADVLADTGRHHPDRAGAGDEHVFAHHVELQRAMRGVAVGVEKRSQLAGDLIGNGPQVGCGHDDVFGERAVAVHADADRVRAQMLFPSAAISAMPAHDVAFGGYALANAVTGDARPKPDDASHEFVANHQARLNGALAPLVPQINVQVGAADRGFFQLDQDLVRPGNRYRHLFHPDAFAGFALDQRFHGVLGHAGNRCAIRAAILTRRRDVYAGVNASDGLITRRF